MVEYLPNPDVQDDPGCNYPPVCGGQTSMTPPNPWFLITFEQIAAIRLNLQVVMEVVPETHRDKVKKMLLLWMKWSGSRHEW